MGEVLEDVLRLNWAGGEQETLEVTPEDALAVALALHASALLAKDCLLSHSLRQRHKNVRRAQLVAIVINRIGSTSETRDRKARTNRG